MHDVRCFLVTCLLLIVLLGSCGKQAQSSRSHGKELRFAVQSDPKGFDPLQTSEESGELIRYITAGALVRVNQSTGKVEPMLAQSWKVSDDSRSVTFRLRNGLKFSNGVPLTAGDVQRTLLTAFDPKQASTAGEAFRSPEGFPTIQILGDLDVLVNYSSPKPDLDRLFAELAIVPAGKAGSNGFPATAGPFHVAEYRPASYIRLVRNAYFTPPPLLESIYVEVQPNREIELAEFLKGDLHLVNNLEPESFQRLKAAMPAAAHDAGSSLGGEFLWFNQAPSRRVPEWKLRWFRSAAFRHAVSSAIHRDDLSRVVFNGFAHPAAGPFSPGNRFWFNHALIARPFDAAAAFRYLSSGGFKSRDGSLYDADGHPVEFSLITNAGNKSRERAATVIQDDLKKIGIRVNFVPLDFGSLVDRITKSMDYEACLLGFANVDLDPVQQNNVWLSSGPHHAWWPLQKSPGTPWEREIDKLTMAQASETDRGIRKKLFDRVQQIVYDEEPIIYLVNSDVLAAIAPAVRGAMPVPTFPQLLWNVERLDLE